MPIGQKLLVNNIGQLRIHETLMEGWKPAMIEDGHREGAGRLVGLMSPERSQLALAENMMFGVALEQFIEARPAHQLLTGHPGATASWRAVGKYNQFFEEHSELYVHARSNAPLAIIMDDRGESVPVLDGLASRRVLYNIIYERDVTAEALARYKAVAVLNARVVRDSALSAIEAYVRQGGKFFAAAGAGTLDENDRKRAKQLFASGPNGAGQSVYWEQVPSIDEMAKELLKASGGGLVHIEPPPGVLYNVTGERDGNRVLVHLLNYTLSPVQNLDLKVDGAYRTARLLSPDSTAGFAKTPALGGTSAELRIPNLKIYSVVVLEKK
jgi:hypothetical protein